MEVSKVGINPKQNIVANNRDNSPKSIGFGKGENEDEVELSTKPKETKKRSLTAKKRGVGLVGPFYGNLINGNPGKAFGYLGAINGAIALSGIIVFIGCGKNVTLNILAGVAFLGALGINIGGRIDAVKHVKPDQE